MGLTVRVAGQFVTHPIFLIYELRFEQEVWVPGHHHHVLQLRGGGREDDEEMEK